MNKLEYHKKNKSWDATLNIGCIYRSKATKEIDICLANLCSKENKLTLNREKGFEEVEFLSIAEQINQKYAYLMKPLPKLTGITPKEFGLELVFRIKKYFKESWDSTKKHIMLHSGGLDSRILSYILRDLREEMGKDWIGEINFRCYKPEQKVFISVMEDQGWDRSQYNVYRADTPFDGEYFNWYNFDFDANGYFHNGILVWDDLISAKGFHENVVFLSGNCGGEVFNYPVSQKVAPWSIFNFLMGAMRAPNVRISATYNYFGDVLLPYIAYDVLDWSLRIPNEFWVPYPGSDKYHDLVRMTILREIFGDKRDSIVGHVYRFDMRERKKYIETHYHNSKFFRDYGYLDFVANATPWEIKGFDTLESKLYGYATMYEIVTR